MTKQTTYRISFHNQGKIYEIYALDVHQSGLFGFIEVENIVIRIDEVEKSGHGKITDSADTGATVTPFPVFTPGQKPPQS